MTIRKSVHDAIVAACEFKIAVLQERIKELELVEPITDEDMKKLKETGIKGSEGGKKLRDTHKEMAGKVFGNNIRPPDILPETRRCITVPIPIEPKTNDECLCYPGQSCCNVCNQKDCKDKKDKKDKMASFKRNQNINQQSNNITDIPYTNKFGYKINESCYFYGECKGCDDTLAACHGCSKCKE